jgi:hypothetical protein
MQHRVLAAITTPNINLSIFDNLKHSDFVAISTGRRSFNGTILLLARAKSGGRRRRALRVR